jgi:hypothetical protein
MSFAALMVHVDVAELRDERIRLAAGLSSSAHQRQTASGKSGARQQHHQTTPAKGGAGQHQHQATAAKGGAEQHQHQSAPAKSGTGRHRPPSASGGAQHHTQCRSGVGTVARRCRLDETAIPRRKETSW